MREYILSSMHELTTATYMVKKAQDFIELDDPDFQDEDNEIIEEYLGQALALINNAIRELSKKVL